jgi:hypothetical protein
MMTEAQQAAHTAQAVDWFIAGAFSQSGFDLDFEAHAKVVQTRASLAKSRARLEKAMADYSATGDALVVYARTKGSAPPMPNMEM